jgi:hypothetical protein
MNLSTADLHHLNAGQGWLELGKAAYINAELGDKTQMKLMASDDPGFEPLGAQTEQI